MQQISLRALSATLVLVLVGEATAQRTRRSETYEDAGLGLSLVLAGEWTRVPQNPNTPWIAARFISDTKPGGSDEHAHVRVVVLPQDPDVVRARLAPDPADPYSIRPEGKGCSNYSEFVEASTEIIHEVGKKYTVKEQGRGTSPIGGYVDFIVHEGVDDWLLRNARVFEREGMKIVVEATMRKEKKEELAKLWKQILASLRPFAAPKRGGVAPDPWLAPRLRPEDYAAWRALPVAKRRETRARSEKLWIEAVKQHTGPSWKCASSKRFFVVSPGEMRPDEYVARLEVFAGFLDATLGPLSDDAARRWVLRMCIDDDHRQVFYVTGWPTNGFTEVAMTVFDGNADPLSYGAAQQTMFWTYLHEKNALVGSVLPQWMTDGLFHALHYASSVHGDAVQFDGDDWGHKFVKDLEKRGALAPLRTITSLSDVGFRNLWIKEDGQGHRLDVQCSVIMCFLLMEPPRPPQLKGFLTRYLQALAEACAGIHEAPDRQAFLDAAHAKVHALVFGSDDENWRQIEAAFKAFVRG